MTEQLYCDTALMICADCAVNEKLSQRLTSTTNVFFNDMLTIWMADNFVLKAEGMKKSLGLSFNLSQLAEYWVCDNVGRVFKDQFVSRAGVLNFIPTPVLITEIIMQVVDWRKKHNMEGDGGCNDDEQDDDALMTSEENVTDSVPFSFSDAQTTSRR